MGWASAVNSTLSGLMTFVWIIIIGGMGFIVYLFLSHKHTIELRMLASNTSKRHVQIDKFKLVKKKDGTIWWKTLWTKKLLPVAPAESIDYTKKGKMFVLAYMTPEGNVIYACDDAKYIEDAEKCKSVEGKGATVIRPLKPFTSSQRALLVDQVIKAEQERGTFWKDNIVPLASLSIVAIMVVILIINWDVVAGPALATQGVSMQVIDKVEEIKGLELQIAQIKAGVQRIEGIDVRVLQNQTNNQT